MYIIAIDFDVIDKKDLVFVVEPANKSEPERSSEQVRFSENDNKTREREKRAGLETSKQQSVVDSLAANYGSSAWRARNNEFDADACQHDTNGCALLAVGHREGVSLLKLLNHFLWVALV